MPLPQQPPSPLRDLQPATHRPGFRPNTISDRATPVPDNGFIQYLGEYVQTLSGGIESLNRQWVEFSQALKFLQETTQQLHRENGLITGETQRQSQLLVEHHEGIHQLRAESHRDDQALHEQISNLRIRLEQLGGEFAVVLNQPPRRDSPTGVNEGVVQQIGAKLAEAERVLGLVTGEIGALQRTTSHLQSQQDEGLLRLEELTQEVEETWNRADEVGGEMPLVKANVDAIGQNQSSFHEQLGALVQEIQAVKADQVQQQFNANLLKEKTREGLTNLHTNMGHLRTSSRKNLEALDTHCQEQHNRMYEMLRKEIQEGFALRDRKIRALEDFCTTASYARAVDQAPAQDNQGLLPGPRPVEPEPSTQVPTSVIRIPARRRSPSPTFRAPSPPQAPSEVPSGSDGLPSGFMSVEALPTYPPLVAPCQPAQPNAMPVIIPPAPTIPILGSVFSGPARLAIRGPPVTPPRGEIEGTPEAPAEIPAFGNWGRPMREISAPVSSPKSPHRSEPEPTPGDSVSQVGNRSGFRTVAAKRTAPPMPFIFRPSESVPGGVDPSLARGVGMIGTGSDAMTTAALMMNFAAMNNPLMSQLVMGTNQPKFKGTVENFPEFRRQWGNTFAR